MDMGRQSRYLRQRSGHGATGHVIFAFLFCLIYVLFFIFFYHFSFVFFLFFYYTSDSPKKKLGLKHMLLMGCFEFPIVKKKKKKKSYL